MALAVALIVGAGAADPVSAQNVALEDLKAGFVYNFARFTEWPSDALPAGAPLVLCIADNAKVAKSLEQATIGKDIDGHSLKVREVQLEEPVRSCHLLYADGLDLRGGARLIESLKGAAVLTLSDLTTFASIGGTANLSSKAATCAFR